MQNAIAIILPQSVVHLESVSHSSHSKDKQKERLNRLIKEPKNK